MRPILFEVLGLKVHSYGAMLVVAFFVGLALARKRAPKFGIGKEQVYDAGFWALIVGILGARVLFILQSLPSYLSRPEDIWTLQFQGLTSFGGLIGGALGLLIWSKLAKKRPVLIFDVFAAAFLLAHPIGRIGCLLNGCCYGGHCDLPWGIHVTGQEGIFHPAQIYDGILNLAALGVLLALERRSMFPGKSISLFLILHGLTRFIYEFWRAGTTSTYLPGTPITDAQAAALFMVFAGALMYFWFANKAVPVPPEAEPA